ncbi:hypothetical protein D3C86_1987830 [compost metagenome]
MAPIDLGIAPGQEIGPGKGNQHNGDQHKDRQHRHLVARQAPDGVLGERAPLGGVKRCQLVGIGREDLVFSSNAGHQRYLTLGSSQA